MTLHKILKYLALVIGVIGLILLGRILFTDGSIEDSPDLQNSLLSPLLYVAYLVLAIAVVLVILFVIRGLFTGSIKNTLISVGIFIAIVVIGYVLADGTAMYNRNGLETIDASGSKWVGAGLITFYILAAIAILAMLISGVRKLIK